MKYSFLPLIFLFYSFTTFSQEDLISLLPDPYNLPGLQTSGEPKIYKGDNLFDLMNGGADVYFEYGFIQVITQAYTGISGKINVKVEIYQMTDNDAAFGIISISAAGKQIHEEKGVFSASGSGYAMRQKGAYFIMISYANVEENLKADLIDRISGNIESKINQFSNYPGIYTEAKQNCAKVQRSLYFKGNIALRNATYLDFKIPFNYTDGLYYRCDILDYLIFNPQTEEGISEMINQLVENILTSNPAYNSLNESFGYSIKEADQLRYHVSNAEGNIVLIKYN